MLKILAEQTKGYRGDSVVTPIFMILEVILETLIPLMMSSIIDDGVEKSDLHHIIRMGMFMVIAAAFGLFTGLMGAKYGARASTGLAKNLRKTMFEKIQGYSFSNIDKFSTAGLGTRMTTDVTNLQNAFIGCYAAFSIFSPSVSAKPRNNMQRHLNLFLPPLATISFALLQRKWNWTWHDRTTLRQTHSTKWLRGVILLEPLPRTKCSSWKSTSSMKRAT